MRLFIVLCLMFCVSSSPVFAAEKANKVVAKVGGRVITLDELKQILNSSPYGSADKIIDKSQANNLLYRILIDIIDKELLYLDAANSDIFNSSEFKRKIKSYEDFLLADLYEKYLIKTKVFILEDEITDYAGRKKLTREAAKAMLNKTRRKSVLQKESSKLFDFYKVKFADQFAKKDVKEFKKEDLLVSSQIFKIKFGEISGGFNKYGSSKNDLFEYITQIVETRLFANEGRKKRFFLDQTFKDFTGEYRKSLVVNLYRKELNRRFLPDDSEISNFIGKNAYLKHYPQKVLALLIVVASEEEAQKIKKRAERGENFYRLAMENSIAPNAKVNAGDIGPITIGENPYSVIDAELLALKPGEVSSVIKGKKGYSIFKMIEKTERKKRPDSEIKDEAIKLIIDKKMAAKLSKLRKSGELAFYGID